MGKKNQEALAVASQLELEEELFAELDARQDMKAFDLLARSDPESAGILSRMVDANISSERIIGHMLHKYPHLWPQTQALLAAARHLEADRDE